MSFVGIQSSYVDQYAAAYAGMIADGGQVRDIKTLMSAEASAQIPFGVAVAFKPSPTYDTDATMPANSTDLVAGILVHSHDYARQFVVTQPDGTTATVGDLGTTGVAPGAHLGVMRKGRIWVVVEDGCAVGDRLYVRYSSHTGVGTQLGAIRATADSGYTIDLTKVGQFVTSCAAAGLAMLEVDFTNKP